MSKLELLSEACGLWRLREDEKNAYAIVVDHRAILIDPLSTWKPSHLRSMRVRAVDAILLTRPEKERLLACAAWKAPIHLSGISRPLLAKEFLTERKNPPPASPVSPFYDPPHKCPARTVFDLLESADFVWKGKTFRFLATPGHTPAAITILLACGRELFAFSGDAVCPDGRIWHPHHLEWDHWTSSGIRASLHGLDRLAQLPLTHLLPSRGKAITRSPRSAVRKVRKNLDRWAAAKEAFVPGVRVDPWDGEDLGLGVRQFLPSVHHLGGSAYFVFSGKSGDGLLVDALRHHEPAVRHSMALTGIRRLHATATHYHCDHTDGLNIWRDQFDAKIILTQTISEIVRHPERWINLPFRGERLTARPDLQPQHGESCRIGSLLVTWHDLPGQTRYHDGIALAVDGARVLFSGDNFFHPLRYGGTGGCCVANHSRPEDYARSARTVMRLHPHLIAAGHNAAFHYSKAYFQAVIRWAARYRSALQQLHLPGDSDGYYSAS